MTPEFKYGLLSGVGISLWMAAEFALGLHTTHSAIGEYTSYCSLLILLHGLFLLLEKKRSEAPLNISSSLMSGVTAAFLGSLIVYGFTLAYNQWINPDWVDNALALKVAAMRSHNVEEIEIRRVITAFRHANSPTGLVIRIIVSLTALGGIFSGLLVSVLRQSGRPASGR